MDVSAPPVDPRRIELVVLPGRTSSTGERQALVRDVERGLRTRLMPGVYVARSAYEPLSPEDRHFVRMRAYAAASSRRVVFSHWSAAVLQGLPVLRSRLARVHVTVDDDDPRHRGGAATHLFALRDAEVVEFDDLFATSVGRTVVDIAGAAPLEEGVMAADAALRAGVPRRMLEAAADLAGPRRAASRIAQAVAFAHPGGESAGESRMRLTLMRLGVEVPLLQHRIRLRRGADAYLDGYLPAAQVGLEMDGDEKYLDPRMAREGTGRALVAEKRREDEVRLHLRGLVRPDWFQSVSTTALGALLARVGVVASRPRTTFAAYCEQARDARPRFLPKHPRWR